MTSTDAVATHDSQNDLFTAVSRTVMNLQQDALGHRGDARKTDARRVLAELRRGAGSTPEQQPLVWQSVLNTLNPPLSKQEVGHGDAPSPSENAAFAALTMFAWHMHSAKNGMHIPKQSFGSAIGRLVSRSSSASLQPRFNAMLVSRDTASRLYHARTLIALLRSEAIGFDYGQFARDLRGLSGPRRDGILLRWGRDFATATKPSKSNAVHEDTSSSH